MRTGSLALFVIVLAAGTARAQSPDAAEAAYVEGRRLYDLQEWDQAIERFKEAYKLEAKPRSLFNIAQAYRLKGDCAEAARFYKTFKRNYPKERNVDQFIVDMDACAKAAVTPVDPAPTRPAPAEPAPAEPVDTGAPSTSTTTSTSPGATPVPEAPRADPGKGKRIAGIAIAGVGAASVIAGVVFGVKASSAADEAMSLSTGEVWDPDIEERGLRNQSIARWTLGIGGAALVGGTVLYLLGRSSASEHATVGIVPSTDGGTVVWGGAF